MQWSTGILPQISLPNPRKLKSLRIFANIRA
jgi:hypothetical protein